GTVAVIAVTSYISTRMSLQELQDRYVAAVSQATAAEVHADLIAPAGPALEELRALALNGLLPVNDSDRLGEYLVGGSRSQPSLDWLYYGDQATGSFVAASKGEDGTMILTRSAPNVDAGQWQSVEISPSGTRTPTDLGTPAGFDPRERPWYQLAVTSPGVAWTEPYEFHDGKTGISAVLAMRLPGSAALQGVFAADLYLDEIAHYISGLTIGRTGRVFVLSRAGHVLETAHAAAPEPQRQVLAAAIAELPQSLATLPMNVPTALTVTHDGV